ncbi:MAG: hypothetical protein IPN01_24570 [Deltaproteobacteria bacterium]|nr:hypothetical protein [Deltaproteobacteria bacterium]
MFSFGTPAKRWASPLHPRTVSAASPSIEWPARASRPSVAASITGHDPNVMLKHYRAVSDDDLRLVAQQADLGWFARALTPALETQ